MLFAVCGLHLSRGPLNRQLLDAGGKLIRETKTIASYSMYALSDASTPRKPGLVLRPHNPPGTGAIDVEVWEIPEEEIGNILKTAPPPLGMGTVWLEGGEKVHGFVAEGWAADPRVARIMGVGSTDITSYGGWMKFLASSGQHE